MENTVEGKTRREKKYGYVQVHGSGFPLQTVVVGDRRQAAEEANRAYRRACNTGCAYGVRFGVVSEGARIKGKLVMCKSWRKYVNKGPF